MCAVDRGSDSRKDSRQDNVAAVNRRWLSAAQAGGPSPGGERSKVWDGGCWSALIRGAMSPRSSRGLCAAVEVCLQGGLNGVSDVRPELQCR